MEATEYIEILDNVEKILRHSEHTREYLNGVQMVLDVLEIYKPKR